MPGGEPCLYIVLDTRVDSLRLPGKAAAQAAHAANDAVASLEQRTDPAVVEAFKAWKGQRTFGTTIVLENTNKVHLGVLFGIDHEDYACGTTTDDGFPVSDGLLRFTTPHMTAYWVFTTDRIHDRPAGVQNLRLL